MLLEQYRLLGSQEFSSCVEVGEHSAAASCNVCDTHACVLLQALAPGHLDASRLLSAPKVAADVQKQQ